MRRTCAQAVVHDSRRSGGGDTCPLLRVLTSDPGSPWAGMETDRPPPFRVRFSSETSASEAVQIPSQTLCF